MATVQASRPRGGSQAMRVIDSFLDATGETPLVRLSRVTRGLKPTVLA